MSDVSRPVPLRSSLRRSALIALAVGVALWVAANFAIGRSILVASMLEHERSDGESLARRMQGLVDAELARLERTAHDWSAWDETWAFARDEDPGFVERNIHDSVLANLELNLMAFVGADDRVHLLRAAEALSGRERPAAPEFARLLAPRGAWTDAHLHDRPFTGLVASADGVLAFAAQPIHRSAPAAPGASAGSQVFGRLLGEDFIAASAELLQASFELFELGGPDLPADVRAAVADIGADRFLARPLNPDRLASYTLLRDLWGQPVAILRATSPRSVYIEAKRAERWLLFATLGIGLLAGCALYALMSRRVLGPLQALEAAVNGLARDGAIARVAPSPAQDEFARLGQSINALLDEIEAQRDAREARDAAQATSRVKGELLANVAESTRAPLAELRLALDELLGDDSLGTDVRAALERAWRAGHGVGAALGGLPANSRIDGAAPPFEHRALDVRRIVEDAATAAAARGAGRRATAACRVDPDLAGAYLGDEARLRALLHALLADWPATSGPAAFTLWLDARLCERGDTSDGIAIECSGLHAYDLPAQEAGGERVLIARLAAELGGLLAPTPAGWRLSLYWPRATEDRIASAAGRPHAGRRCLLIGDADAERDVFEAYLRALGMSVTPCTVPTPAATHDIDVAVCLVSATRGLPRLGDLPLVAAWPAGMPPAPRVQQRVDIQRPVRWSEFVEALERLRVAPEEAS